MANLVSRKRERGTQSANAVEPANECVAERAVAGGERFAAGRALAAGLHSQCAALILGAGDIDEIKDDFLRDLALRSPLPR